MIQRELGLEKLRINWELKALKYEEKIRDKEDNDLLKVCWKEKETSEEQRGIQQRKGKILQ